MKTVVYRMAVKSILHSSILPRLARDARILRDAPAPGSAMPLRPAFDWINQGKEVEATAGIEPA
jgi:hypothetical protein